jgi:hypothetical protein
VDGIGKLLDTEWQNAQLKQLKQLADVDFKKLEPVTVEASKKAMIKVEWERVDWAWPIKLRFRGPAAGELKLPSEIVTTADATEATFEVTAAAKAGEYMVEVYNAEKPANKVQLKVTVK